MSRHSYSFRSEWHLAAPASTVYEVLERLPDYPAWWPEVREVTPAGPEAYALVVRSTLPYSLRFLTTQGRRDPEQRVLEARMTGDLEGFSRWTIHETPTGAVAVFEEDVEANKALLRRLAAVARPAFRYNHMVMMRHGERGLRTYLAGYHAARG